MTEFLKEFFQTFGERLRNRIFGPFIVSFFFWNWKPVLLILASKAPIENTIKQIENEGMFSIYSAFLIPLGISFMYSLIVPFLSLFIVRFNNWPIKKSIKAAYELKRVRKEEEGDIAILDHKIERNRSGEKTLADLNNQIKVLETSNQEYIDQNHKLRDSLKKLETENLKANSNLDYSISYYSNYVFNIISQRYSDQDQLKVLNALTLLNSGDVDLETVENEIKNDLVQFKIVNLMRDMENKQPAYFLTDFGKLFISHILNSKGNA